MLAQTFWKVVVADHTDFLDRLLDGLTAQGIRFCVLGGQGVNAYVDPVVSLGLDIVIAVEQSRQAEDWLRREFLVEAFPHILNVSATGSDLRVQLQTDPRYAPFVAQATEQTVLGRRVPVASLDDLLQGKLWAAQDSARRASKRQKDLADIARLIEAYPHLRSRVPADILSRLI
ncbi:MAG: nucleotidyl transferase AbiEii/AbiGii toxin family protein [Nitrospiraceae bacterium]